MKLQAILLSAAIISAAGAAQAGDASAGAVVFRKCQSCHSATNPGNRVGPSLMNLIGRPVATSENFRYSEAMTAFGAGKVWDEATLTEYLAAPRDLVPGTRMAFPGLKTPEDIANVIAYIKDPAAAQ
ncbi:c-type cytochrome [Rhizobium sp. LjRoot254]|uniref:c-type cytochrome n=1 Tax=Rhizobium sp. LjRoot254 TaxID=3342297 RepID=UPI003ECF2E9F